MLRCAVLLDEMAQEFYSECACVTTPAGRPLHGPLVVAQCKSSDGLAVLQYSCSNRVVPVPTSMLNARRYSRLLWHPITAHFRCRRRRCCCYTTAPLPAARRLLKRTLFPTTSLPRSHLITDFNSDAHGFIHHFPQLEGVRYGDLHAYFPGGREGGEAAALLRNAAPQAAAAAWRAGCTRGCAARAAELTRCRAPLSPPPVSADGTVLGVINQGTGYLRLNPVPDKVLVPGDELVMLRPSR